MIGWKGFTSRKSFCRSGSQTLFFEGREATTGNASAVRRLPKSWRGSFYIYLLSFPRFWTLSVEWFWFLFCSSLNGVTLKTSNYLLQEKQLESIERYKMRFSIGEDQMDVLWVLGYGPGGEGVGYSWEFLVVVCRPVLQILTLFQTKNCNFPHPFSDQTSKIHTCFQTWPLSRNYFTIT